MNGSSLFSCIHIVWGTMLLRVWLWMNVVRHQGALNTLAHWLSRRLVVHRAESRTQNTDTQKHKDGVQPELGVNQGLHTPWTTGYGRTIYIREYTLTHHDGDGVIPSMPPSHHKGDSVIPSMTPSHHKGDSVIPSMPPSHHNGDGVIPSMPPSHHKGTV